MIRKITTVPRMAAICLMSMALSACKGAPKEDDLYAWVSTSAKAHNEYRIGEFYIDGRWGGSAGAYGNGGGGVCCVRIPKQWHEGLTAKVEWSRTSVIKDIHGQPMGEQIWYQHDAPILPYKEASDISVHFFADNTAKIVVISDETLKNPPITNPVAPKGWTYLDQKKEYCDSVKLTNMTYKQCIAKMQEKEDSRIAGEKLYEEQAKKMREWEASGDPNYSPYREPPKVIPKKVN